MAELPTVTVDVRDMLCAQALAVVAQATLTLQKEQTLAVFYNTDDVAADLRVWAKSREYDVEESTVGTLRIARQHMP